MTLERIYGTGRTQGQQVLLAFPELSSNLPQEIGEISGTSGRTLAWARRCGSRRGLPPSEETGEVELSDACTGQLAKHRHITY
jgi:hypothetical protein